MSKFANLKLKITSQLVALRTLQSKLKLKHYVMAIVVVFVLYLIKSIFFPTAPVANYITAPAIRGNIEQTVLSDGTIKAFKQVSVGAQASGQIKKLYVELGDEVKLGDLIAEIDDLTQKNALKQAESSLASLQAQRKSKEAALINYKLTYQRQSKLVTRGAGAQSDLDQAKANLDSIAGDIASLDAQISSANVAVDTAKLNLDYTKITAPMDGVIVARPVDEGQTVNSVQTTPTIVKVAQLDKMTIEAQISEADVIKVKKGMPVYFTILGKPNERYADLTLRSIEPAPDSINTESTSTTSTTTSTTKTAIYYNGLFDVDNPDHELRISMTAQVYIVLAEAKAVISIPSQAIQSSVGNKGIIYVLNSQEQPEEREVMLGINDSVNVEVKSGIQEGERIIIGSANGLSVSETVGRRPGPRIRL